jgi:hypothetical protein
MSTPLPPPPPPVPRAQPAGYHEPYHEPYGAVQMTQRRTAATEASSASYYHSEAATTYSTPYTAQVASPMYYAAASPSPVTLPSSTPSRVSYAYNRVALVFLLPPLLAILYTGRPEEESETSLLLPVLLCTVLVLYSLDLANLRNASLSGTWMAFVILSATNAIDTFRKDDDTGFHFWMFQVVAATLLLACLVRTNAKRVIVDYHHR